MKIQYTKAFQLAQAAETAADSIIENAINHNMTLDEAVGVEAAHTIEHDQFDELNFDVPYDEAALRVAYKAEAIKQLADSPEDLMAYADAHEEAMKGDYVDTDEYGNEVDVFVVELNGIKYHITYTNNDREHDTVFHHNPKN